MKRKISWNDFEAISENYQYDFEKLSRIFFKYRYIKNPYAILNKIQGNPGIETEPILINGLKVGFQAKYFTKNISYDAFLDSSNEIIKYYKNTIDKVIIFCNKDVSLKSETYKKMVKNLADNNIEVELCCNDNILDIICYEKDYLKIKEFFFGKKQLSNEWFKEKLQQSLSDLEPRYVNGFHIDVDAEGYFHSIYSNEKVGIHLKEKIQTAKEKLKNNFSISNDYPKFYNDIQTIVNTFSIPARENYYSVNEWHQKFNDLILDINEQIEKLENEIEEIRENNREYLNDEKFVEKRKLLSCIYELISIIDIFDFQNDEYISCLNRKNLLIEGEAGYGKSHLLGYIAEQNGINDDYRTILLLGHKFIFSDTPQNQIMKILDCSEITFDSFLEICEVKGELDGTITIIMIDAINECQNSQIWKGYINELFKKIQQYNYVRLICSIRSTYMSLFFDESNNKLIESNEILCVELSGFRHNLEEAIPLFFKHYDIPITINAYQNFELANPLFLKMFCESYEKNTIYGSKSIFGMYNDYLKKEEDKIKSLKNITSLGYCSCEIFERLGEYFYENNVNYITYSELNKLVGDIRDGYEISDGLIRAKALVSYYNENDLRIYTNYEKFNDYLIAAYILKKLNSLLELKEYISKELFKMSKENRFIKQNAIGIFIALSVLVNEKYGEEIIECLDTFSLPNSKGNIFSEKIIMEYIEAFPERSNADINYEKYCNSVLPKISSKEAVEKHFELFIKLSGRNCSFNANTLTAYLKKFTLPKRDFFWTIYINSHYYKGELIYNIIDYFLNHSLENIEYKEKQLYLQLLMWLLTSSNRLLRDKTSRAIIKIMKNDLNLIIYILKIFIDINDTYVVSRMMGCIYGSILQTEDKYLNKDLLIILANIIYEEVFHKDEVYTDILFRDYALNIIEYINYKGIQLTFNIELCRPPYKSFKIPDIDISNLREKYQLDSKKDRKYLGTDYIFSSLRPDFKIENFCDSMYGDFGRYTFEISLSNFVNLDKEKVFKYAFDYIISSLKYDNKFFTNYDRSVGFGRGRENPSIERIGKKYQWIAMYHILALITDNYQYEEEYSDIEYNRYRGSWRPFIRDFDPTLNIETDERKVELNIDLYREPYSNWQLGNNSWATIKDLNNFTNQIKMKDSNGDVWLALWFSSTDASGNDYQVERQSTWNSSTACFIKKKDKKNFINKIKNRSFYGRWLNQAEASQNYNMFLREYCWSPAYKDEFGNDNLEEVKIQTGTRTVKKEIEHMDFGSREYILEKLAKGDFSQPKIEKRIIECNEPVYEVIGSIMPCYRGYSWEKEYDYSKESKISICVPCKLIVDSLGLKQNCDGIWYKEDEIVCVDFSLIKNSNIYGIYIKEKYMKSLLKEYELIWIGLGEKQHTFGLPGCGKQFWNEISSLVYENEKQKLVEKLIFKSEE